MRLTVLSVGYPLAPVSPDAAGGAEQVLCALDRALAAAGHLSLVLAPEGSRVAGELIAVPAVRGPLDEAAVAAARARHRAAVAETVRRRPVDIVHLHGVDFDAYLPQSGPPALATLHLPLAWYGPEALAPARPDTWLHCVSDAQARQGPTVANMLPPIPNGVDVEAFRRRRRRGGFALFLGRICPEKGVHLAIAAARRAGVPLVVAGEVFPYPDHLRYFAEAVEAHLGPGCRFVGPVGLARKRRLLAAATCLLIPSTAAETSSLVAREAAAAGTPVIAFPSGALAETVEAGRTGFLVDTVDGMAAAIGQAGTIDPERCRAAARERFALVRMTGAYLGLYRRLARGIAA